MFVCCECYVLSGRGLCDGLITRPEESYRLRCVIVCDQEASKTRRLKPATGLWKYNQTGCNARKTNKHGPALCVIPHSKYGIILSISLQQFLINNCLNFHIRTVHLEIIKVFLFFIHQNCFRTVQHTHINKDLLIHAANSITHQCTMIDYFNKV